MEIVKKKTICLIMTIILAAAVITACGKNKNDTDVINGADASEAADTENSAATDGEAKDIASESTETEADENNGTQAGYIGEALTFSSPGSYTLSFAGYDEDENPIGEFEAKIDVELSETTDGVDAGMKKVVGIFHMDISENGGPMFDYWLSAFDYYTGTSFETASVQNVLSADETLTELGTMEIEINGETVTVSMIIKEENNYPDMVETVEVYCPADYDGTVFEIGQLTPEEYNELIAVDFSTGNYIVDELPNYSEKKLLFRYQ